MRPQSPLYSGGVKPGGSHISLSPLKTEYSLHIEAVNIYLTKHVAWRYSIILHSHFMGEIKWPCVLCAGLLLYPLCIITLSFRCKKLHHYFLKNRELNAFSYLLKKVNISISFLEKGHFKFITQIYCLFQARLSICLRNEEPEATDPDTSSPFGPSNNTFLRLHTHTVTSYLQFAAAF